MEPVIKLDDILEKSNRPAETLVHMVEEDEPFTSTHFSEKREMVKTLFNLSSSTETTTVTNTSNISKELTSIGSDRVIIRGWKNTENISARLIEKYDEGVVLECLVDKENWIYEEREFSASLFIEFDLTIGNIFYLRFFERPGEHRMEIHSDPNLTFKDDFPKQDFSKIFGESKLFKK